MFEILYPTYTEPKAHVAGCKDVKRVVATDRIEKVDSIPADVKVAPCVKKEAK